MKKTISSHSWLERQSRDPYVLQARKKGYRSRALFKIEEIHEKFDIFQKNKNILDLGAAPGGWSQYVAQKLSDSKSKIFAIDLLDIKPIPNVIFFQNDITTVNFKDIILEHKIHVVMSDMSPNSSGHKETDHLQIMSLCEIALEIAKENLVIGGTFIVKAKHGAGEVEFFQGLRSYFKKTYRFKPKSSRKESKEFYIVAMDFMGNQKNLI